MMKNLLKNKSAANLYPASFEQKIGFDKIREILTKKCLSKLGEEEVGNMIFLANFEEIDTFLSQTDEMMNLLLSVTEELPIGNFFDIRESLARVKIEGLFLDEVEIFELKRTLDVVNQLVLFLHKQEDDKFPYLKQLTADIQSFDLIVKQIDKILDKYGKIKDNASLELSKIRKDIFHAQSSISKTLNAILRQAQTDGYVEKDVSPTLRDGRLVIPVLPAFKRKINGIVHDESATGKTIFIEPQQVVDANNRVRELEAEERREIIKILTAFTNFVRPYFGAIIESQYFLGKIDFIRSKALLAIELGAIKPQLENKCVLEWENAIHPLLYFSLKKQEKKIVPLAISLHSTQRILIISGPNAGGKSVCLKTVALLQQMLQCGLLIPLDEKSKCGIFQQIFIDIGDEQSIENDLSTYSSHLLNMKYFIKNSNENTLLLIDEFGSGTEPLIGGAIAEATLERFNRNKSFGVITTHYTNLKHYAEATEGIVNGAMLYDRQQLQPLFQLFIGNPGSSFAVEIARKIGLPEDLIADAAIKVGADHLNFDKNLQDIVRDKRYWERKRQEIRLKEKKLEETLSKYEDELAQINKKQKEIIQQSKTEAENLIKAAYSRIESTIKNIVEAKADKEKTKRIRYELESFKEEIGKTSVAKGLSIKKQNKEPKNQSKTERKREEKELIIGQNVRMKGQTAVGTIIELQKKMAVVAFGQIKSTVKIENLETVQANQTKKKTQPTGFVATSNVTDNIRSKKLSFQTEIDVRGMRADEAIQAVTYFIDDAMMVGISSVRILHGTGTGALRQLIRQYLNSTHGVKHFRDEHVQFGGAGITVVEFE